MAKQTKKPIKEANHTYAVVTNDRGTHVLDRPDKTAGTICDIASGARLTLAKEETTDNWICIQLRALKMKGFIPAADARLE